MNSEVYSHVISLGHFCSPALEIEKYGYRDYSYPFDWCLTDDFSSVLWLIENDFKGLFNIEKFYQWKKKPGCYTNIAYKYTFVHDFSEFKPLTSLFEKTEEKYKRRIDRFYQAIKEPTLFVRYIKNAQEWDYICEQQDYITTVLRLNVGNKLVIIGNEDYIDKQKKIWDGVFVYPVKPDENDVVSRDFFDQIPQLVDYISQRYDENKQKTNLQFFKEKQGKKIKNTRKEDLVHYLNIIFRGYYRFERQLDS